MPVSSGTNVRVLVYNTVTQWLGTRVNIPAWKIRVDRQFAGPPPGGYGQTRGAFMTMCDDVSATLATATGRRLSLSGSWRLKHQNDVIADYINGVAVALMAAPMSPVGRKALTWAMD